MKDLVINLFSILITVGIIMLLNSCNNQSEKDKEYSGYYEGCLHAHYLIYKQFNPGKKKIDHKFAMYANKVCNDMSQARYLK